MANKRMVGMDLYDTDDFMDMPASAQNLHTHLILRADDDGFIGKVKRVANNVGSSPDDLKILIAKRYLISFENTNTYVLVHFPQFNTIRKDRKKPTIYQKELNMLTINENGCYEMLPAMNVPATEAYNDYELLSDSMVIENVEITTPQPSDNQVPTKCQPKNNHLTTPVLVLDLVLDKELLLQELDNLIYKNKSKIYSSSDDYQNLLKYLHGSGFSVTDMLLTDAVNLAEQYGSEEFIEAVHIASAASKPELRYVMGVLKKRAADRAEKERADKIKVEKQQREREQKVHEEKAMREENKLLKAKYGIPSASDEELTEIARLEAMKKIRSFSVAASGNT